MIELLGGAVGGIFGGLFRLAPEVIKFFDRRNDRKHELEMLKVQVDLEKTRGEFKLAEVGVMRDMAVDTAALGAYTAAIKSQADMSKAAGGFAATASALVRPLITYAFVGTYLMLTIIIAGEMLMRGVALADVARYVLTPDFIAIVSGIVSFWFLSRTLEKRGL
jgi:hypothetical protein